MQIIPLSAFRPAVPVPVILPRDMDECLSQRWDAALMAEHAYCRTSHDYEVVRRQAEFERRLDALATQRGRA